MASSVLTCNGLALQKGLVPPVCIFPWRNNNYRDGPMDLKWPHSTNNPTRQWGNTFNNITLLSSPQTALLRVCLTTLAMSTKQKLTAHVADKETLLINCHDTFWWKNGETVRPAPFPNRRCQQYPQTLGRHCQQTRKHQRRPAPTAIKTQTLPNCVLIACAYQSARRRNMGIA